MEMADVPIASPIEARCRHCGSKFDLGELTEAGTGRCPFCNTLLSPDWTSELLEQDSLALRAQTSLVKALRRLNGLPGNLRLLPHSVLRNLFEEIGWEQKLAAEPSELEDEIRLIRMELEYWQHLDPAERNRRDRMAMADRLRALASRLHATQSEAVASTSSGGDAT
jgi:hypothetical protein